MIYKSTYSYPTNTFLWNLFISFETCRNVVKQALTKISISYDFILYEVIIIVRLICQDKSSISYVDHQLPPCIVQEHKPLHIIVKFVDIKIN